MMTTICKFVIILIQLDFVLLSIYMRLSKNGHTQFHTTNRYINNRSKNKGTQTYVHMQVQH